ncbi:MAG: hypothetical protein QG632_608 [Candidatus Dependentiae bacterium]|nr:hypothetical protein [Candidatus Dependentiae bacterium]
MNIRLLIVLLFSSVAGSHAVLEYGGKTYFSLPHFDAQRCQETALWHTHTTTDIGNPIGLSVQIVPFVNKAINTEAIARHLTLKDSETIQIASDRFNQESTSVLPYSAIVHNPSLSATEGSATLTLTPDFTNVGATFSAFFDAKNSFPGIALSFQMPLYYTTAILTQAGGTKIMDGYFSGTFSQITPIQAPLSYGLFGKHRHTVCGPLNVSLRYSALENESNYLTVYGGAGITLKKKPAQIYLFDYHSTAYDHHKFTAGVEAGATIGQYEGLTTELITQFNYQYIFGGSENRLLGLIDDDGSIPYGSPYLLGAQVNAAGVFPLPNVLYQPVNRAALNAADVSCMLALTWQSFTFNLGYELFARQEERLTILNWPEGRYAIVSPLYNTSAAFTNAVSTSAYLHETILLNHRILTTDMLNASAATSPAQVGGRGVFGVGYNTLFYGFPVAFGGGLSFTAGFNKATASLIGCWFKVMASF